MSHQLSQASITGIGVVSCAGVGADALWRSTYDTTSHIQNGIGHVADDWLASLPPTTMANRALSFCILAIAEAMNQAGWTELTPADGIILATTTGQFLQWDGAFIEFIGGKMGRENFRQEFLHQPLGELTTAIQKYFNHTGPYSVVTSACTAATQAIALGSLWLKHGRVKRVLVGGVEVLCRLTCDGFKSLQLLSPEPSTPFDRARRGINLSEGAAFLCLESGSAKPLAEIAGVGFSTDGYHMTAPHPEGEGCFQAMSQALRSAQLEPSMIDWIHAHGTGSSHNDASEGAAVSRLFGDQGPYISSTKWLHGHALGASGAIETALVVRAMNEGRILRTRGLKDPDPAIRVRHPEQDLNQPIRYAVKNTLGFGGANAAIVLKREML